MAYCAELIGIRFAATRCEATAAATLFLAEYGLVKATREA